MDFKNVRELAVFVRDEMDKYAGQQLPDSFVVMFNELCSNIKFKKMMFKGSTYSSSFITILRPYRIEMLANLMSERQ